MPNDHGIPDSLKELMSISADLLPATIISTTWPTPPVPPGMTLAAFGTRGYVRDGPDLVYVDQPAQAMTLTGADGTYWISLTVDTFTDYAQWSRNYGSHYCWRPSSSQPADVDGLLVIASMTVSGGAITAVTPIASRSTLAAAWRGLLALGTLATQNAAAVAITGGVVSGLSSLGVDGNATAQTWVTPDRAGSPAQATVFSIAAGAGRFNLYVPGTAANYLAGVLGLGVNPAGGAQLQIEYPRTSRFGIQFRPTDNDTANSPIRFTNLSGVEVGTIYTTATATAYNTSSDARLKHAIAPLTGSLDLLRRLNPISHRWNADDSYAENFLAHELQRVLPYAVTGEPDALNDDGSIRPQQVDASKIIPRLVGAVKELLAQVDALTARVATLETALGM